MNGPQRVVHLAPGEHVVGDERMRVHTLLGSCVSITLWQPERRIGAMSHFLLAERGRAQPAPAVLDARYGDEALALLCSGLAALGVAAQDCVAKVFGGGNMFPAQPRPRPMHVGQRNGDAALRLLAAHGIEIASHSLFGNGHRRVVFDIASGDVWSRHNEAPTGPRASSWSVLDAQAAS